MSEHNVEDEIVKEMKRLKIKGDGLSYGAIHDMILEKNPKLHTRDQLSHHALELYDEIYEKYGRHLCRVYASYPFIYTKGYHGFDMVYLYEKTLKQMKEYTDEFCDEMKIIHPLDKAILEDKFRNIFKREIGFINADNRLVVIIKLIMEHKFQYDYVKNLEDDLKYSLLKCGDKYYHCIEDLAKRKRLLKEIYQVIGEKEGFFEFRGGIYHKYNGDGTISVDLPEKEEED